MSGIIKKIGKVLVVILTCLSAGTGVKAAETSMTEVQISIEGAGNVGGSSERKMESVQTGDSREIKPYLLLAGASSILIGVLVLKKRKRAVVAIVALFLSMFIIHDPIYAAEPTSNVSVTIPSSLKVTFDENGENTIEKYEISNQSAIPITLKNVKVTECNEWKLCGKDEEIPVNTKKMAFAFNGQYINAEENALNITIEENSNKNCDISISRGVWTTSAEVETALEMEFEYEMGKKQFQLLFDENGASEKVEVLNAYNGDTVQLPTVTREGYVFQGWEDEEGALYTDEFLMPIGEVKLVAKWKEIIAYALYIEEDHSLRFIRSANDYSAGSTFQGLKVKEVYTGFEEAVYQSEAEVPWYDNNYYTTNVVKKVIVENEIRPKSTAHWFHWMYDCEYFDVSRLDTVRVKDMSYMFGWAGFYTTHFEIIGVDRFKVYNAENMEYMFAYMGRDSRELIMDLSKWDVSNVTNMAYMFAGAGYFSDDFSIGDLSKWDVSNVTDMSGMFKQTGYEGDWSLDCSRWNVANVIWYGNFNKEVKSKVKEPRWKN